MGRRMIATHLGRSRSLSSVSLLAEVSFLHAISVANDHGLLEADGTLLRADLFPRRPEVTSEELMVAIEELVSEGCLHRYEVDGYSYLHFPDWLAYQRLRTPNPGSIPSPEGHCDACSSIEVRTRTRSRIRKRSVCRQDDNKLPQDDNNLRQVDDNLRQPAASCGGLPRDDNKVTPTLCPQSLTEEEMASLSTWCEENHPDQAHKVAVHVAEMIDWYTDKREKKGSWSRAAEAWIRRNDEWRKDGATGNGNGRGRAKGILEQIHDDAVARSGE